MSDTLLQAISKRVLLGDGAMGTQLQAAGLAAGECGELWNIEHPDRVLAIQRSYVEAGSDILLTNTFGGCRLSLERHGLADKVVEINRAAVRIARQAFGGKPGFVIGDIGPFGGMMEPFGDVPTEQVKAAFEEQAAALMAERPDALIVETQTALEELELGLAAAKKAGAPCVIGSMAYDITGDGQLRTMMGVDPAQAAAFMLEHGADIVALNCGNGMDMPHAAVGVTQYRRQMNRPTMAQPNAGKPQLIDGQVRYMQSPQQMAAELPKLLEAGVAIVGACCGSSPEHIRRLRPLIDAYNQRSA